MRGRSSRRHASGDTQPVAMGSHNAPSTADEPVSLQLIADKLKRLTWRKRLWGVDERQVWHVVERLDEMYRQLYREQEVRYQTLLQQERGQRSSTLEATQPTPPIRVEQVPSVQVPHRNPRHG